MKVLMSFSLCCSVRMIESEFGRMDSFGLVSTIQAAGGGVMLWNFLAHFIPSGRFAFPVGMLMMS